MPKDGKIATRNTSKFWIITLFLPYNKRNIAVQIPLRSKRNKKSWIIYKGEETNNFCKIAVNKPNTTLSFLKIKNYFASSRMNFPFNRSNKGRGIKTCFSCWILFPEINKMFYPFKGQVCRINWMKGVWITQTTDQL